jgi:hypothetical protein
VIWALLLAPPFCPVSFFWIFGSYSRVQTRLCYKHFLSYLAISWKHGWQSLLLYCPAVLLHLLLRRTGGGLLSAGAASDEMIRQQQPLVRFPSLHPIPSIERERERTSVTGVGDMNFDCSRDFEWRSLVMATCTILFGRRRWATGDVVVYNIINFNHGQNFESLRPLARSSSLMRC